MFRYLFFSNLLIIILFGALFLTGCVAGKVTQEPQSKPLPHLKSNLPGQLVRGGIPGTSLDSKSTAKDIFSEADFYAQAVANGNWATAKNMSTEANKLLLEQQIKPQLNTYWRKWRVKLPPKAAVNFEDSLLIKESYDNQIVIEKLEYATETQEKKFLYLQFQITRVGDKYLINDTLLLTKAKIFPGA